jgi:hypothetical protein
MPDQSYQPIYRRRSAASEYLHRKFGFNCGVSTLAKLACDGGGPKFVHVGRFPLYPEDELNAWAVSRISPLKASTSDTGSVDPGASPEKTLAADGESAAASAPAGPPSAVAAGMSFDAQEDTQKSPEKNSGKYSRDKARPIARARSTERALPPSVGDDQ